MLRNRLFTPPSTLRLQHAFDTLACRMKNANPKHQIQRVIFELGTVIKLYRSQQITAIQQTFSSKGILVKNEDIFHKTQLKGFDNHKQLSEMLIYIQGTSGSNFPLPNLQNLIDTFNKKYPFPCDQSLDLQLNAVNIVNFLQQQGITVDLISPYPPKQAKQMTGKLLNELKLNHTTIFEVSNINTFLYQCGPTPENIVYIANNLLPTPDKLISTSPWIIVNSDPTITIKHEEEIQKKLLKQGAHSIIFELSDILPYLAKIQECLEQGATPKSTQKLILDDSIKDEPKFSTGGYGYGCG